MTTDELYNICHDEAVAYANSEQWSKRTGEEKSFLIQGYLDAMMEARKSEITEKKKEYPKTYEECCEVLMGKTDFQDFELVPTKFSTNRSEENSISPEPPHISLINAFYKLLICLDAYWKIAGEEMGLGKPWEPDWNGKLYYLYYNPTNTTGVVRGFTSDGVLAYVVLAFPTEEMRDAFYENFKELIEICKELL